MSFEYWAEQLYGAFIPKDVYNSINFAKLKEKVLWLAEQDNLSYNTKMEFSECEDIEDIEEVLITAEHFFGEDDSVFDVVARLCDYRLGNRIKFVAFNTYDLYEAREHYIGVRPVVTYPWDTVPNNMSDVSKEDIKHALRAVLYDLCGVDFNHLCFEYQTVVTGG